MLEIFKIVIGTVGLTLIITHSKLFKSFRELCDKIHIGLGNYVKCPQCIGFLSGLIVYLLYQMEYIIPIIDIRLGELINYGFIGSFVSYCIYLLLCPLIKKYD